MELPFPIIKTMVPYKMLETRDMSYYKTIRPGAFVQDPGSRKRWGGHVFATKCRASKLVARLVTSKHT